MERIEPYKVDELKRVKPQHNSGTNRIKLKHKPVRAVTKEVPRVHCTISNSVRSTKLIISTTNYSSECNATLRWISDAIRQWMNDTIRCWRNICAMQLDTCAEIGTKLFQFRGIVYSFECNCAMHFGNYFSNVILCRVAGNFYENKYLVEKFYTMNISSNKQMKLTNTMMNQTIN